MIGGLRAGAVRPSLQFAVGSLQWRIPVLADLALLAVPFRVPGCSRRID
jgi:hypothetical protein